MNRILSFFIISACIVFFGCSKDENGETEMTLTARELMQTTWDGSLTHDLHDGTGSHTECFNVVFLTETEGHYINDEGSGYPPTVVRLSYQIDERMITFVYPINIKGSWILIDKSKNQIILQAYLPQKHIMILDRKY